MKKHMNINKFAGLSRDWVGAKKLFMCFIGSFLLGEKHIGGLGGKHLRKVVVAGGGGSPKLASFSEMLIGSRGFYSAPAQGQQTQLKQTSDATSELGLCCRAPVVEKAP